MITLTQLEDTRRTYESGRSNWRIDDECRWSYFFLDSDRAKLLPIAEHLALTGYEFVGTLDPNASDENPIFYLRLDRIETHSPASLHERNRLLYNIAAQFRVSSYDGFDVGAVEGP
jgi:hypothetical protein